MKQTLFYKWVALVIIALVSISSYAQPAWTYMNTGSNHIIYVNVPPLINGSNIAAGDYIGVFYLDGVVEECGGYIEWTGTSTAVTAWGDDTYSTDKDGFANNEAFIWKVWRASDGQVVSMTPAYITMGFPNIGNYATNGLSGLTSLSGTAVVLPLAATGVGTNPPCFGSPSGSINITPTGGTPPYTYNWSNNASTQDLSGLTAGTYTITITDASAPSVTMPWTYMNTGANHIVYVNDPPLVNGTSIAAGDYIGAFYLDGSVEECGGYIEWTGTSTAVTTWGDDTYSTDKDGFSNSEAFIWKVWKSADGSVVPMTPVYMPIMPNQGNYATNGLSGLVSLTGSYTPPTIASAIVTVTLTQPSDIVTSGTITDILCNGGSNGSVAISVSGGVDPYTFAWSNGSVSANLTGVPAGTYTLTVTDANLCTDVTTYTITQPQTGIQLSAVLSAYGSYQIGAFGASNGSVNLTVAGGTSPFVYTWSSGATTQDLSNIPAGSYAVTVSDANSCSATQEFTLTQPTQLVVQHSITDVTCMGGNDGSITLTPSGGISPYTYSWSNGATTSSISNLTDGFYGVTVTDSGTGTYTNLFYIEDGYELQFALPADASVCLGTSYTLSAGAFASYLWSNGATTSSIQISAAGAYSVVVTDNNGCDAIDEFVLTTLQLPVVNLGSDATVCQGSNYTLNAGTFTSYAWSTGATTSSIQVTNPAAYSVTVTDNHGCNGNDSFVLSNYSLPVVNLGADAEVCEGDSYQLLAGSFNSYNWSTGETLSSITVSQAGAYTVTVTDANGCQGTDVFNLAYFPVQPVNLGADFAICHGESATLNAGTYSIYLWSNGATTATLNVAAQTTYTVTVTDANGCQSIDAVFVTVNSLPVFSLDQDAAICSGEDYTLDAGQFSAYLWSTLETSSTIEITDQGTYSVTVTDANGCENSDDFYLTVNALPEVDLGDDASICVENTYLLFAGNYVSYDWSNGATTNEIIVNNTGTYSVTVTDLNGCEGSDSFVLSHFVQIPVNLGADLAICNGDVLSLQAGEYDGYVWSTSETTASIAISSEGSYSVTTTDVNGCHSSDSFFLTVNALPIVDLGADAAICLGDSYTLSAGSFTSYEWSTMETTASISVSTQGTYSVMVTDANGCENSDEFVLTVNSLPVVSLGTSAEICEENSYVLNAGAFVSYNWSTLQNTQVISVSNAGTYTVTVTDNNGCQGSDSFVLSYYPQVLVDLGTDNEICADGSFTLDAGIYTSYAWSTAETTQTISVNTEGTYSVTTTDANGCHSNDSFYLTVNALPIVDLGADAAICLGDSYTLSAGSFSSYEWSTMETTASISVSTQGTYSVMVTDANGCENSDEFVLIVNSLPVVSLGTSAEICEGDSYVLDAGSFVSYNWSTAENTQMISVSNSGTYTVTVTDNNGCQGSDSFILSFYPQVLVDLGTDNEICADGSFTLDAGIYTSYAWSTTETTQMISVNTEGSYSVMTTDANGCHSSDSFYLTVNPLPIVDLGADAAICLGDSYTLSAGSFTSYEWSTMETTASISVSTQGTYSVMVTDANGCENSDEFVLTVNNLPVVSLGTSAEICEGDSYVLDAGSFVSYNWSTSENTQMISASNAGTYSVTVTDNNGCQGSDSFVLSYYPQVLVDLGTDNEICADGSFTLDAGIYTSYAWSTTETTQTISVNTEGTYSVTTTDANGCHSSDSFYLTVNALPVVDLGLDAAICFGDSYVLNAGSFDAYIWSTTETTASITVNTAGFYGVTVTDANGCQNTDGIELIVNDLPIVNLGPDQNFCIGQPAILDAGAFVSFEWSTGETTQTISVNANGNFAVTVTDNNGCEGSDDINLVPATPFELGANAAICNGDSYTFDASNLFDSYLWSTGATTSSITVSNAGLYTVTVTSGLCAVSDFANLTVYSLPVVNLGIDQEICENQSIALNAGAFAQFAWSTGETTQNITINQTGNYIVTVTDIHGCQNSDALQLTVNPLPVVTLPSDETICADAFVTLNAGLFTAYEWSTTATTQSIEVNTSGTYSITVTDANGCENSDSYTLTVNALPVVNLGADAEICFGETVTLDAGSFDAYTWSTAATTQTIVVDATGTYSVTVTDANGCENSDAYTLTVNALPIVNLGADTEVCFGETVTLDAGLFDSYEWSNMATTETIVIGASGTYAVTVTDANGCENSDSYTLTVNPLPVVNLGADTEVCFGETVTLDAGSFDAYTWSTAATTQTIVVDATGTYSVTVTDANGCENSDVYTLTVNALPVLNLGADAEVCFGETVTLDAGVFNDYVWSTAATTQTIVVDATGTYSVTVTDANGCENNDSYSLTVHALPVVNLGADAEICFGETVTLDAGVFDSYEWSNMATTQTIAISSTGIYAVTVTDANGCENNDSYSLTVHALPVVNLGADAEVCFGETVTLDGGMFTSYLWSTAATTQTIDVNASGTYTLQVVDANGCENSDSYTLTVNPLPVVNLGADTEVCFGETVTLDAGVFDSYEWSNMATTQTIAISATGTYAVTVTDANGCENSDAYTLTVNPLPVIHLGTSSEICFGESVTLDAGLFDEYIWSTAATTQTIMVDATGTYSVTVTDANGCENSDSYTLTVNPLPIVNLGADSEVCFGETVTLDAGMFASYLWSTTATTQTININATGTYSLTATDNNGCENSDSYTLTVNALPVVNLGADSEVCMGETVTLDAGVFNSYEWSNTATTQTIMIAASGTYTVTVTDANGCENSDSYTLTVHALPLVNLGPDNAICMGESNTLDAGVFASYVWSTAATTQTIIVDATGTYSVTVTDANGCENNDSYTLTVNALPIVSLIADTAVCQGETITLDASSFAAYEWSTAATTQTIVVDATGTYSVTVTDGNGCENNDSFDLTVFELPIVNLGADSSVCLGETVTLDAGIFAAYEWSTAETTQTIVLDASGTYVVTVTDGNGCQNNDSYELTVNPLPVVALGNDAAICFGETYTLDAGSFVTYEWSTSETSQSIEVNVTGTYAVTVTDNNGCVNNDSFELTVNELPVVDLGGDTLVYEPGTPVVLDPGTFTSYEWSTFETSQTITVTTDGTYSVTVTNEFDCSASDSVVINFIGIADVDFGTALNLYPNPTNSYLNVKADGYRMDRVIVYNAIGEAIMIQSVTGDEARIDVSKLPAGIFFLNVISTENKAAMKSFKVVR